MRIATYNIEWFEALFNRKDELLIDNEWSRRHNVTRRAQAEAIATVLKIIDADILVIIEAPNTGKSQSTLRALINFCDHYGLRQSAAVMGFENTTHQEIAAIYDPSLVTLRHDPKGEPSNGDFPVRAPRFDGKFRLDVDVDGQPDIHDFSKPPMELEGTVTETGREFRLIGVHAKSKAPHGARDHEDEMRISIQNRRKQLAQCQWLRQRVDDHLDAGDSLIVLGDFNDGPGLDGYERLFGRSGVEVVMGPYEPPEMHMTDPHARIRLDPRQGWFLTTARFYLSPLQRYINALLDYVMISPDLVDQAQPAWRIWHPFDDPYCYDNVEMREALLTASDHFPVTVDLNL